MRSVWMSGGRVVQDRAISSAVTVDPQRTLGDPCTSPARRASEVGSVGGKSVVLGSLRSKRCQNTGILLGNSTYY